MPDECLKYGDKFAQVDNYLKSAQLYLHVNYFLNEVYLIEVRFSVEMKNNGYQLRVIHFVGLKRPRQSVKDMKKVLRQRDHKDFVRYLGKVQDQ